VLSKHQVTSRHIEREYSDAGGRDGQRFMRHVLSPGVCASKDIQHLLFRGPEFDQPRRASCFVHSRSCPREEVFEADAPRKSCFYATPKGTDSGLAGNQSQKGAFPGRNEMAGQSHCSEREDFSEKLAAKIGS